MAALRGCILFLLWSLVTSDAPNPRLQLWPIPVNYTFDPVNSVPLVDKTFQFKGSGAGGGSQLLKAAFTRYHEYFFDQGSGSASSGIDTLEVQVASADETLTLDTNESCRWLPVALSSGLVTVCSVWSAIQLECLETPFKVKAEQRHHFRLQEVYVCSSGSPVVSPDTISVTKDQAVIASSTVYGAIRGLETFSQLISLQNGQYVVPQASVSDTPRFQHRGFLVDTSRHYIAVPVILQFLDAMSFNKFNVLHWHIVDDQSFPYVSTAYPELSAKGAYSPLHIYSPKDVQNVIAYAKERGIRVVPEFDTPGHSISWGKGQPGLSTACYNNQTHKPTGSYGPIDPTNESNWVFLQGFFKELSEVFSDQYLHLGGDEVSFACWSTNPNIWEWLAKHNITGQYDQLEQYYETRLLDLVGEIGKSYVVWEEIFDNGLKVKPDTVIEVWKSGLDKMAAVTKAGLRGIYSTCWYINYIQYGANDHWKEYYSCDPQDFEGSAAQMKLVTGGEACIWGEFVDGTNVVSRAWPSASAVGERLWSPQYVTDVRDAESRISNQRCRMVRRGLPAEPLQGPGFCPVMFN